MRQIPMKKIDKDDIQELIKAIKQFTKDTKDDEAIAESSRLTSKDILFYYLTQHQTLCERVDRIETELKMLMWFTGIALAVISVGIGIFKL